MSNYDDLIARLHKGEAPLDDPDLNDEVAAALTAQVAQVADLTDALRRNGFVTCDIAACNCGSWHARYGLPERMAEVREALAEAGHPLCNENGNLVSRALQALIAERDARTAQIEALRADLISCRGTVKTELHHYERLAVVHGKTTAAEVYDAEAERLKSLLDRIDLVTQLGKAGLAEAPKEPL